MNNYEQKFKSNEQFADQGSEFIIPQMDKELSTAEIYSFEAEREKNKSESHEEILNIYEKIEQKGGDISQLELGEREKAENHDLSEEWEGYGSFIATFSDRDGFSPRQDQGFSEFELFKQNRERKAEVIPNESITENVTRFGKGFAAIFTGVDRQAAKYGNKAA